MILQKIITVNNISTKPQNDELMVDLVLLLAYKGRKWALGTSIEVMQ